MDSAAAESTGSGSIEYLKGLTVDYDKATYTFQVEDQKISALLYAAANGTGLSEFRSPERRLIRFGYRARHSSGGETGDRCGVQHRRL
jgi:hypothetical protein